MAIAERSEREFRMKGFAVKRLIIGCTVAGLAWLVLGILVPTAAHAEFYSLDGRFQCLDHADAVCGDARPLLVPAPAKPAAVVGARATEAARGR
jgi:hypothetical protein